MHQIADALQEEERLVIFVHNLAYEWQFIRDQAFHAEGSSGITRKQVIHWYQPPGNSLSGFHEEVKERITAVGRPLLDFRADLAYNFSDTMNGDD